MIREHAGPHRGQGLAHPSQAVVVLIAKVVKIIDQVLDDLKSVSGEIDAALLCFLNMILVITRTQRKHRLRPYAKAAFTHAAEHRRVEAQDKTVDTPFAIAADDFEILEGLRVVEARCCVSSCVALGLWYYCAYLASVSRSCCGSPSSAFEAIVCWRALQGVPR